MRTAPHAGIPTCRNAGRTFEGQPRAPIVPAFVDGSKDEHLRSANVSRGPTTRFIRPPDMWACRCPDLPVSGQADIPANQTLGMSRSRHAGQPIQQSFGNSAGRNCGLPTHRHSDAPTCQLSGSPLFRNAEVPERQSAEASRCCHIGNLGHRLAGMPSVLDAAASACRHLERPTCRYIG